LHHAFESGGFGEDGTGLVLELRRRRREEGGGREGW